MSLKIKLIALAVVVAAVGAAAYFLVPRGDSGKLKLYGNVDVRQVDLAFTVEGRLQDMLVEEGDHVAAGQVLAHIEPGYFEDALGIASARVNAQQDVVDKLVAGSRPEEVDEARARVATAKAELVKAQQEFTRQKELVARKASPQRALDDARAALDVARGELGASNARLDLLKAGSRKEDIAAARAQLNADKSLLGLARRRLKDATLLAPADGVIMSRVREPGAVLAPGTSVYTMSKTKPLWVRAFVPEPQLGHIKPGMEVKVFTDSRPDRPYGGKVGYIAPSAEFTPKSVQTPELRTDLVFRFHVVIDNPDDLLRQGMPVTVVVE